MEDYEWRIEDCRPIRQRQSSILYPQSSLLHPLSSISRSAIVWLRRSLQADDIESRFFGCPAAWRLLVASGRARERLRIDLELLLGERIPRAGARRTRP